MQQKTRELLEELRYFCPSAFCWDLKNKGRFSILKLMKNHGFFQVIDLEAAIENWQLIENRGAVAPEYTEGLEDRKDLPDKEEQRERNKIYQSILSLLKYNLTDLQAFLIRGNYPLDYWDTQEFIAFDFSQFSRALIVGKAQDNNWVSLCPTFPNESNVITFLGGDWELAAFLDEKLEEINIYELSFWCVATRYLIGRIETKDWLGISSDTQMHYNP